MFSVRLLIDRLATLEPRTALTTVWLSIDASCKKKTEKKNEIVIKECDIQYFIHIILCNLYSKHVTAASFSRFKMLNECLIRGEKM